MFYPVVAFARFLSVFCWRAVGVCGRWATLFLKDCFAFFIDFPKLRFAGVPPLPAQIGYALEGVVVFFGDVVHVVALDGSPSDVCSVELLSIASCTPWQ